MRNIFLFFILLLSQVSSAQQKVVLISIDGLRPEFYLDSSYPTPNLQSIKETGCHALKMKSVFPSYTYPSHAAMLTGALPARSGIFFNAKPGIQAWNWFLSDVKSPTIWEAARNAGKITAAIQWPISVSNLIHYNIPEIWDTLKPEDRITISRKYATPGLIEEIEENATGKLDGWNMNEKYLSLDINSGRMAAYVLKKYRPDLLAVHLAGVDGSQHQYGRENIEVRKAIAAADRAVGDILETLEITGLKDSTAILIVGDHGFMDYRMAIRPNLLLQQYGILDKVSFNSANGASFLYGADTAAIGFARQLFDTLFNKSYFTVLSSKQLHGMGADPAAAFALSAKPGYVFVNGANGPFMIFTSGATHGYDPALPQMMTGFLATGPGICKGAVLDELCVTDIAPLLAKLLNLTFISPDGKLVKDILTQD